MATRETCPCQQKDPARAGGDVLIDSDQAMSVLAKLYAIRSVRPYFNDIAKEHRVITDLVTPAASVLVQPEWRNEACVDSLSLRLARSPCEASHAPLLDTHARLATCQTSNYRVGTFHTTRSVRLGLARQMTRIKRIDADKT
jgi:hypothetical protein